MPLGLSESSLKSAEHSEYLTAVAYTGYQICLGPWWGINTDVDEEMLFSKYKHILCKVNTRSSTYIYQYVSI